MLFAIGVGLIVFASVILFVYVMKGLHIQKMQRLFVEKGDIVRAQNMNGQGAGFGSYAFFIVLLIVGVYLVK